MTVSSRNLAPQADTRPLRNGRINPAAIAGRDHYTDWLLAVALWLGSALGNVAAFNGGMRAAFPTWSPASWRLALWPTLAGLVMQALLQWYQFCNAHHKRGWKYSIALLLSAGPSLWAFAPVFVPLLAEPLILAGLPWYAARSLAAIAVAVAVIGVDIAQELLVFARD